MSPFHRSDDSGIPDVGAVVGDRYRVEGPAGRGAMGAVLAARSLEDGRPVAIKVMFRRAARRSGSVERFLREARAAAAIQSPFVVNVFEVSRLASGVPYMVMEYLEGEDLRQLLGRRRQLSIQEAASFGLQAAVALAACHDRGITHRDFKPDNLMVVADGEGLPMVKLVDFGIAKQESFENLAEYQSLTGTLDVFGTPTHMSPEQVKSTKAVDHRTDLWALGVVLYELFTGLVPFIAPTLPAMALMVTNDLPSPPGRHREDLPPELERLILACLQKSPEERPSARTIARHLAPFAGYQAAGALEHLPGAAAGRSPLSAPGSVSSYAVAGQVPVGQDTITAEPGPVAPLRAIAVEVPRKGRRGDRGFTRRQRLILGTATGVLAGTVVVFVAVLFWAAVGRHRPPAPRPSQSGVLTGQLPPPASTPAPAPPPSGSGSPSPASLPH